MPERKSNARWEGSLTEGNGNMRLGWGAWEGPYSFTSRFEEGEGTNPEELIAGAHAGCFSMALSGALGKAGYEPRSVDTEASVRIEKVGDGFGITRIRLSTRADVPGIEEDEFRRLAEEAKEGCPVSQALKAVDAIELEAELVSS